jgi:hypothetical protein
VLQADVAQVAAWSDTWEPGDAPGEERAWRRDDFPDLSPSREDRALFCGTDDETTCLAQVRAAPEAVAEAVSRNAGLVERIQRLRDTEVLRNAMPAKLLAPMPAFTNGTLPMTAHALVFVQGDEEEAVTETCRDLAAWRQLALNTDLLIGTMVGIAYAGRGYGELLAEMLAEWPVDRPLPAACEQALAPPSEDDLRLCHAARGEFRVQQAAYDLNAVVFEGDSWLARPTRLLLYDHDSTVALAAENLAPYCRADRAGRLGHDWPESHREAFLRWTCVGNFMGCALTSVAHGGLYGDYADRMLDFDARHRQLRVLLWMREQAAAGARADALIKRLPPDLQDAEQPIELGPDGRSLRVALIDDRRGEWAEIPLPPVLWSVSAETADPARRPE